MRSIVVIIALVLAACSSAKPSPLHVDPMRGPVPGPSPVAPAEADLRAACAALARLECPEAGRDSRGDACPEHMARIRAERVVIPTQCLIEAATKDAVRICGDTSTLTFRCR